MTNPIRLSLMSEKTTYRTDPPSTGEPEWGWEDFCHAASAGGCTDLETAALEYRWRQAGKRRHTLYAAMMIEALKAEKRHGWSERIQGNRYLEPMVQLALDVEAHPRLDGIRPLVVPDGGGYKRYEGWWCIRLPWMTGAVWDKTGELRYSLIRQPLDIWAYDTIGGGQIRPLKPC